MPVGRAVRVHGRIALARFSVPREPVIERTLLEPRSASRGHIALYRRGVERSPERRALRTTRSSSSRTLRACR